MKSLLIFLEESETYEPLKVIEEKPKAFKKHAGWDTALSKLKVLKDTGWRSDFPGFDNDEILVLKSTITDKPPVLYRGMSLNIKDLDEDMISYLNSLNKGDIVDKRLHKRWNSYASYTPELRFSKKYALNGDYNIIMELKTPNKSLICDCNAIETTDHLTNAIIRPENEFLVDEKQDANKITVFSISKPDTINFIESVLTELNEKDLINLVDAWNTKDTKYGGKLFRLYCRRYGIDVDMMETYLHKYK